MNKQMQKRETIRRKTENNKNTSTILRSFVGNLMYIRLTKTVQKSVKLINKIELFEPFR